MRVGITLLTQPGHNIWSAGIGQNVYHLAVLIQSLPFVEKVIILDCGNQGAPPENAGEASRAFDLVPIAAARDLVDVAIEMGGALPDEWVAYVRARGGSIVYYNCGHPYAGLVDATTFNKPSFFGNPQRADEVWLLAKDQIYTAMMRSIYRCQVIEVPYLWAPLFLEHTISLFAAEGSEFGYQPGSLTPGNVNPAIFEPNLSPRKCGLVPFLICETAQFANPELLGKVRFLNSFQMKDQRTFSFLVDNSSLFKNKKVSIEQRDYFAKVMGQGSNVVVSHQIEWSQNYLYLDALFGNYPLIHNSELFKDVGYYYRESDIAAGYQQILTAIQEHDINLADYRSRSAIKIDQVSPHNRANRDAYARLLLNLQVRTKRI